MTEPVQNLQAISLVALAYLLAASVDLLLSLPGSHITLIWLPSGLALGVLLRWGNRLWPAIALAALLANAQYLWFHDVANSINLITAVGYAAGSTLEALLGCYLIRRYTATNNPFRRSRDVFLFIIFGALFATTIGASFGTIFFAIGQGTWEDWERIWFAWWLADMMGVLVVTPLIPGLRIPAAGGSGKGGGM